jgi:hypothetical protein
VYTKDTLASHSKLSIYENDIKTIHDNRLYLADMLPVLQCIPAIKLDPKVWTWCSATNYAASTRICTTSGHLAAFDGMSPQTSTKAYLDNSNLIHVLTCQKPQKDKCDNRSPEYNQAHCDSTV